ncbi:hypothetical protein XA26_56440 [Mycolicibacterium fortuitum]|uniref:Uncharacterized protein n=1 Tax=Mycolicibacterium fortuitum TaxID=1766 RepID=A0A0N9Y891_MYCFO|nr:hypothetical protein G155_00263 [Mycobacterium sp. VKM Ac-1817D]ALI29434.1 hypothetical protein XA26_56440 [Mycolicibacterium fortuitum]
MSGDSTGASQKPATGSRSGQTPSRRPRRSTRCTRSTVLRVKPTPKPAADVGFP